MGKGYQVQGQRSFRVSYIYKDLPRICSEMWKIVGPIYQPKLVHRVGRGVPSYI